MSPREWLEVVVRRASAVIAAAFACGGLLATGPAHAGPVAVCGLPDATPLWIDYSEGSVGFRQAIFARPAHPYSRHLIAAAPDISGQRATVGLAGRAPSPGRRPVGCSFAPRCPERFEPCAVAHPGTTALGSGRTVKCYLHGPSVEPPETLTESSQQPEPLNR